MFQASTISLVVVVVLFMLQDAAIHGIGYVVYD